MQESFSKLKNVWLEQVEHYARDTVVKVLIGTKSDLTSKREVDYITAKVSVVINS